MKKLLAIVISMAMIVAMMPMGVFATVGEGTVDTINDLQEGVDFGYGSTLTEPVNIDGNGIGVDKWADAWVNSDTTIKGVTFYNGAVFNVKSSDVTVTLENCIFYACDQDKAVAALGITDKTTGEGNNGRNNIVTNTGAGMCLNLEQNKDTTGVKFIVKNCTFIGENDDNLTVYGDKYNESGKVIDSYKKRGHAIALNAISGGGTAGTLESLLIESCNIDGVRGNAIQLYGTTGNITIKDTKINSWGVNNGAYNVGETTKDANSAAIRGDFNGSGNRTLTIDNVYFGMDEDETTDTNHKINHINVGDFAGNTDGSKKAGTYSVCDHVASIGTTHYDDLAEAIGAAGDNDTIKLIKNVELNAAVVIPKGKNATVDLNGYNMTTTAAVNNIINNGTLTIKDSGENGSIISSQNNVSALLNNPGATAVIKSGTLSKTANHYVITNHGTLTIDGGKITSTSTTSSAIENGWYTPSNNTGKENSILTINDGTIENTGTTADGGLYTLKNDDYGIMYINGGTFTNTTDGAGTLLNWNEATITGGVFNAKNVAVATMAESSADDASVPKYDFEKGITTITGGIFNAGFGTLSAYKDAIKVRVTGGTFVSIPDAYIAEGYEKRTNDDGTYTVSRIYSGGGAVVPPTTDNVTNNTTEKNTTADLTPAVSDNKSTTTVDSTTADKIVDKAVENKSTEVIVDAKGNNTVASSEVAIPEKTVKEISEKTDANLVIKTDNGQVDLDRTAVAAVAEQAGTAGTVTLVVETVKTDADICHVDLKLVTSNGAVKDFKGGNVKVTIDLDKELAAKELVCVYIDDNGIYTLVEGVLNADGTYTFTTGHFSEYAVMAKADADKVIADQLNTLIKEVNLKVRTSKTSKKNIKAVVSGDVKALTDAGYTVKYKFYRSTKKASKYTSAKVKDTNTYINTVGKKGTKYYYKAKALVYDGDKLVGQTELKQCKYGVRTWSK